MNQQAFKTRMRLRIPFKILCCLVCISSSLWGASLDDAKQMESEGLIEDARKEYSLWLSDKNNTHDEQFGRILIYTLRMGGDVSESFDLIDSYLPLVQNKADQLDILNFAITLSSLTGQKNKQISYWGWMNMLQYPDQFKDKYDPIRYLKSDPLSDPSFAYWSEDLQCRALISYLVLTSDFDADAYSHWIQRSEASYMFLKHRPDWLYALTLMSEYYDLNELSDDYRKRVLQNHSASLEAQILSQKRQALALPISLLTMGSANPVNPQSTADPSFVYLQVGVFGKRENATSLESRLINEGLKVLLKADADVFKVIVVSDDLKNSSQILKSLNISYFELPYSP